MKSVGVGCDLVFIPKFQKILKRTPGVRKRIFLLREEQDASIERLAGIFAAKEATLKALGIPAGYWQTIEIQHQKSGKPKLIIHNLAKDKKAYLSITHDGNYALAFVVII